MRKLILMMGLLFALVQPARADEVGDDKALLGVGIGLTVAGGGVSLASASEAVMVLADGLGEHYTLSASERDQASVTSYALLGVSVAMVVTGVAMTTVGAQRLNRARRQMVLGAGGLGVRF
jgi:hypothetical protein